MLRLQFFGTPVVTLGGQPLHALTRSPLLLDLFAYLITHRDRPHARLVLATRFWPEASEPRARRNLNSLLYRLQHLLQTDPTSHARYLVSDSQTVQFNPAAPFWLDVVEFETAAARLRQGLQERARLGDETVRCLERAVALYRGDFLEGVYADWCAPVRDKLREQYLLSLETLITAHQMRGHSETALSFARQWLQADPLREEAHYRLIQLCAALCRTHEARAHYQHYEILWRDELKLPPSARMQALFRQLIPEVVSSTDVLNWDILDADMRRIREMVAAVRRQSDDLELRERLWPQIADESERVGLALKARFHHEEALSYLTFAVEATSYLPPSRARDERELALRRACDEIYDLQADRKNQAENLQRASHIAESLDDVPARADILARQAWLARAQGNHAHAIALLQQMQGLCQGRENRSQVALAYRLLGIVHEETGDYRAALAAHTQALALDEALNNPTDIYLDLNNLATVLRYIGHYTAALDHLHRAQALLAPDAPLLATATLMGNVGNLWVKLGQWVRAADYLREAMALVQHAGDREAECWLGGKLAVLYQRRGEKDRALHVALHYYRLADELDLVQRATELAERLASLYCEIEEGRTAVSWAERAEALAQSHNMRRYRLRSLMRLAQAYLVLAEADSAFSCAQAAQSVFETWDQPTEDEAELFWTLARSAQAAGADAVAASAYTHAGTALRRLADWITDPELQGIFLKHHPVQMPRAYAENSVRT